MCRWTLFLILATANLVLRVAAAEPTPIPTTVKELAEGFDPRQDPLDSKLVREWEADGIVYRYVTFHVGTFKQTPARMAAFYAFPKADRKRPGLLHIHGGGQRAFLHEVEFYARRGYACLSINWGGREMEQAQPGDANTDWGAVDPTQKNVPGYSNLRPGDQYLDPVASPRNNNWYLLTLGARRGLTFLEQQPEVDPDRLGVYGHSMGGNLTIYVAGTDTRIKVAAPSVGGSGFRHEKWPLLPAYQPQAVRGDVRLMDAALGFENYAPRITVPLMWLGATNDFHGLMDQTYRTGALIPHGQVRYAFTPHMNHRFTPEFSVTRPLWLDQHLKGDFSFPETPASKLILDTADHVPILDILPDRPSDIDQVHLYYSIDPDPRARFWRTADSHKTADGHWQAPLPILDPAQPLFAFANVVYRTETSESEPRAKPTDRFALSSLLHTATPGELAAMSVRATDKPDSLIDDFTHGRRDWYRLNADNPHHWEYSTRKLTDPKWQGRSGQRLTLQVQSDQPNDLVIVLTENFFRSYRGPQRELAAVVRLNGGRAPQTVTLAADDFQSDKGDRLSSWASVDILSLRPYAELGEQLRGSKSWVGPQPEFRRLGWTVP